MTAPPISSSSVAEFVPTGTDRHPHIFERGGDDGGPVRPPLTALGLLPCVSVLCVRLRSPPLLLSLVLLSRELSLPLSLWASLLQTSDFTLCTTSTATGSSSGWRLPRCSPILRLSAYRSRCPYNSVAPQPHMPVCCRGVGRALARMIWAWRYRYTSGFALCLIYALLSVRGRVWHRMRDNRYAPVLSDVGRLAERDVH